MATLSRTYTGGERAREPTADSLESQRFTRPEFILHRSTRGTWNCGVTLDGRTERKRFITLDLECKQASDRYGNRSAASAQRDREIVYGQVIRPVNVLVNSVYHATMS